ncbi:hypothetical protein AB1Y20_000227 [Prymnesium parvum]|uniref:Sfi1 spindle body domain-containing protein n=1 Tax=Prymnesium parvum TaxID=97485 RepID=A0AB34K7W2_PRYPA
MGGLRAAINTWKGRMEHFRMLRVYSARMVHMPVFVALRKWLRLVGSMRLLRRVVVTWGNMKAARALSGWKWSTYNRLRLRKLLASCLTPFPLRHIRRALNSWKSAARRMIERKKTWQQLRHAVATLSHQGIAKAIHKWEDCTRRRKAQLDLVDVALTKWTERRLPKAWNSWKYAPKGPYQRMPRVKKILAGFFKASLLKAFNTWVATLNKLNQAKRRLRGALNTLCHKGYRAAWLRWCEEWRERSRLVHGAELVYDLLQGSLTRRAWNSWLQHVDAKFAHSERLETVAILLQAHILRAINKWRSLARKRRRLKRSLNAFGSSLLRPFNTWLDAARHAKLAKERLAVSLGEFEGKGIRTGFFTWLEFVDQRQHLLLCFQTLMHKHLRQAMNTWANKVMEILDEADQLQSVVTALSPEGQKLRRALNSWLVFVQHTKNVSRALLALAENGLHRGFVSWLAAMNERIRKKVAYFLNRELGCAMNQLREYARVVKIVHQVISTLQGSGLRKGMRTWAAYAEDRYYSMDALDIAVHKMCAKELSRAYESWAALLDRPIDIRERAISHMRSKEIVRAFHAWSSRAEELLMMSEAMANHSAGSSRRALNTWIEWAEEQGALADILRGSLARMARFPLVRMFSRWAQIASALVSSQRYEFGSHFLKVDDAFALA